MRRTLKDDIETAERRILAASVFLGYLIIGAVACTFVWSLL